MKVLIYCQHVLGIGHLFRTLEIARAMKEHRVTLVLGGPPASINLPDHVSVVQLPGLQMDADFSEISTVDPERSLEDVKSERTAMLLNIAEEFQPDIILIELFPFGRNGFSFELIPLLNAVKSKDNPLCKVVCSLRDILVEKKNQVKFENRVIERLNSFFDALLVHGDPKVISLHETFSRVDDIAIPVIYTGYISEKSTPAEGQKLREEKRIQPEEKLIVVSTGGGNVGNHLLVAALYAFDLLDFSVRMQIFTGPYLRDSEYSRLKQKSVPGVHIERFSHNFTTWLDAADLSISMGGYNTTMNVIASGTPALILPFDQNREQRLRAEHLSGIANIIVLDEKTLSSAILAEKISAMLLKDKQVPEIQLDGAARTNQWITQWATSGKPE